MPAEIDRLRTQAATCRRIASGLSDRPTADALKRMADECEAKASEREAEIRKLAG